MEKSKRKIKLYNFTFVYADGSTKNYKISVGLMLDKVFNDQRTDRKIKKVLCADSDKFSIYTKMQILFYVDAETEHFYKRFTEVQ